MVSVLLLALALHVTPQAPKPREAPLEPFGRLYALGEVGDHDGDGLSDFAVAGQLAYPESGSVRIRIVSAATLEHLTEFVTPVIPECGFHMHEAHVRVIGDVDGDGFTEFAANGPGGWLLDGRTGAVLLDCGSDTYVWGLLHARDEGGGAIVGVLERKSHAKHLYEGLVDAERAAWSVKYGARLVGVSAPSPLDRTRLRDLSGPMSCVVPRASQGEAWFVELLDSETSLGEEYDDALAAKLRVSSAADGRVWFEREFDDELGWWEFMGPDDFRGASIGDLDGDGVEDLVVAVPLHLNFLSGPVQPVYALSGRDGRTFWKGDTDGTAGQLNPSVDLVADRDGDGRRDVMISISRGTLDRAVQILSSKNGARLAEFRP